jgi:hypothetical protein
MKTLSLIVALAGALAPAVAIAQAQTPGAGARPAEDVPTWSVLVDTYLYLEADDLLLMPVVWADRGALHLEARFQYEDLRTASLWAGRRFTAGTGVELELIPMAGVVFGRTTGVAPGLGVSVSWRALEFYSENEYVFDVRDSSRNFGYNWSELGWQLHPSFRAGLAAQRTEEHRGARWVDRGVFGTVSQGNADVTFYWFNLEPGTRFAAVALTLSF